MASDGYQEIGRLDAIDGSAIVVGADGDRRLLSFATPGRRTAVVDLGAEAWDALRELLDRAAMPGQRVNHGPACRCTPCLAEPSYAARRAVLATED